MKFVPNLVSAKVARTVLLSQKHSPSTLFAAGLLGMGATVVLSCRATLKLDELLDATSEKLDKVEVHRGDIYGNGEVYTDKDADKDKIKLKVELGLNICRLYGPAILCGVASASALAKSHNLLSKRNAALIAAYGTIEKAFSEYRERVSHELGEDREKELYYDVVPCEIDDEETGKKTKTKKSRGTNMYARLFGPENKNYERNADYNFIFLKMSQNHLNDRLKAKGHVFLNEVYDQLGFERSMEGQVVGWLKEGKDGYIDFGIFEGDSDVVIDFMVGREKSIWLDFNVDGIIHDKI